MKQVTLTISDELYDVLVIVTDLNNERAGVAKTIEEHASDFMSLVLTGRKDEILKARIKRIEEAYLTNPAIRAQIEGAVGGSI